MSPVPAHRPITDKGGTAAPGDADSAGLPPVRRRPRPPTGGRPLGQRIPSPDVAAPPEPVQDISGEGQHPSPEESRSPPDSTVGYRRPPAVHWFKKGQSGYPTGRPRGCKNTKTLLAEELSSTVTIREGGKSKKVSKRQLMVKRLANKAAEGDPKAIEMIFKYEGVLQQAAGGAAGLNNPETVDQGQDQINGEIVKEFARMVLESPEVWRSTPGAEGGEDDKT